MQIELIVNPSSVAKRISITGEIYFKINDYFFPEKRWDDFVVVILGWWLRALRSNSDMFELLFMDGPLEVRAKKVKQNEFELSFIHRGDCVLVANCSENELKNQVAKAARKILRKVTHEKWESPDIKELRNGLRSLKNEMKEGQRDGSSV